MRDPVPFVRKHGVVRSREVVPRAGKRAVAAAVESGRLLRPRKGWLAVPEADPFLIAAARAGVLLTCVTQLARLGVWAFHEPTPHVAAPAHSGRVDRSGAVVHWAEPVVPRHPSALVDPIENALVIAAACQPFESALVLWESALNKGLIEHEAMRRLPLPRRAREVLEAASPFSDSGLETIVVSRLRWLRLPIRQQIWIARHRVDILIGDRLVVQIDGGHHVGAQRSQDIEHDARLKLLGYHVIRVGYEQIVFRWHEVQELIMRAVAQGLHRAA